MRRFLYATAAVGVALALASALVGGWWAGLSALAGAAFAVANLGAYTLLVKWKIGAFGMLKLVGAFLVMAWLLVHLHLAVLPFLVGYLALPVGAVVGALWSEEH